MAHVNEDEFSIKSCGKRHAQCKICRPEAAAKMSVYAKNRSPEHQAKLGLASSIRNAGKNNPRYGKHLSPNARARIAFARVLTNPSGLHIMDGYAYIRVVSGRHFIKRARAVWVRHNGPIPKGMLVHHNDEDTMNDMIENLRCVTRSEHSRIHKIDHPRGPNDYLWVAK